MPVIPSRDCGTTGRQDPWRSKTADVSTDNESRTGPHWVEPWQPRTGQRVRFRLGERQPYKCRTCGFVASLDYFAELSGGVYVVAEVRERLTGTTRCTACGTAGTMEDWLAPFRFLLAVPPLRWNRQIVEGIWAAAVELRPVDGDGREPRGHAVE